MLIKVLELNILVCYNRLWEDNQDLPHFAKYSHVLVRWENLHFSYHAFLLELKTTSPSPRW